MTRQRDLEPPPSGQPEPAGGGLRFRVLGPIEAWDGDRAVRIGGPREQKLLATLLLHARQSVAVPRLAEAIWGEDQPATARAQVHNSVAALRRNLTTAAGERAPIARAGAGFLIGITDDQLDAARFARQVAAAERLAGAGRTAEAADLLRAALDLWRGPALGGIDARLLGAHAHRLDEQRLACLERHLALGLDLGRHAELTGELAALIDQHPLRERLVELQLLALYRSGRRQDALRLYAATRRRLADQTGLDPRPELDRLHQAVLRADPALDLPSAPAEPPVPPRSTVPAPEPRAAVVPAQLPVDTAGFTGRRAELAALDRLAGGDRPATEPAGPAAGPEAGPAAGPPPPAIVTIAGPPGVGKTALAVHWAHCRAAHFPDGCLHIDLRGYGPGPPVSPSAALGRFLRGLGQPPARIAAEPEERAAQYRSLVAGRRILVVLDNAATSAQVRPLLPTTGPQATVVTSRHPLDGLLVHEGARQLDLAPLPEPDAVDLVRAAVPATTGREPVTALVRWCDRLPLALRIAAARVVSEPGQTVAALVDELRDEHRRLAALSLPSGEAAVRTAFATSYQALTAGAARLLRMLGLHPGPAPSVDACARMLDLPREQAADWMRELATRALVTAGAEGRCRPHDLVRLYARERAVAEEPAAHRRAARRRALQWYLAVADAADHRLRPARDVGFSVPPTPSAPTFATERQALAWLDREAGNLLAAVTAAERTEPALCWRLAAVMYGWLERRHRRTEWLAVYRAAARAAEAVGDVSGAALVRQSLAICLYHLCRHDEAVEMIRQVVAVRRRLGEPRKLAVALMNLGNLYVETGRPGAAIAHLRESLALLAAVPDTRPIRGIVCNNLGWAHYRSGRPAAAAAWYRDAVAIGEEVGDPQSLSFAEGNLALLLAGQRRPAEALAHWQRALRAARRCGDRSLEAGALTGVARARIALGEPAAARPDLRQALAIFVELGDARAAEVRDLLAGSAPP